MKTILILLDTVRKDHLKIYNPLSDVKTPNVDFLSESANVFCNHNTGSLPCMPARRDLYTGRIDFLERFWGGVEPFDIVLQKELSNNGVKTHISTDHAHYWRFGGEGYIQYFDTYDMIRGQESDNWVSSIDSYTPPTNIHGRFNMQYEKNKSKFIKEEDYPTIRTFDSAIEYLKASKDDNFYLQIEGFDPHEPFHIPERFLKMYEKENFDGFYNSPKYGKCDDTKEELEHINNRYKANLSFADYGLGRLIDCLQRLNIYDECNIIFTTDHGFHLGEHESLGKGVNHIYNEISQIPLIHKLPFQKEQNKYNQFTQNIDIMPTLLDMYKIEGDYNFHGKSYYNLLTDQPYVPRKAVISGYFGQSIMVRNEEYTLFKAPCKEDSTLCHYTAMPTTIKTMLGSKYSANQIKPEDIEVGRFLNHTDYPVFKFKMKYFSKFTKGEIFTTELYKNTDIDQLENLYDSSRSIVNEMNQILRLELEKLDIPKDQYSRYELD